MPWPERRFRELCGWVEPVSEAVAAGRLRRGLLGIPQRVKESAADANVVVSACLVGVRCRYDGASNRVPGLWEHLEALGAAILPLCPEYLAGFGVPRPKIHFRGGDGAAFLQNAAQLVDEHGRDRSASFRLGVCRAIELSRQAKAALLKESSPSCGLGRVHVDEGFVSGRGAWAAALSVRMLCFSERQTGRFLEVVARLLKGRQVPGDI